MSRHGRYPGAQQESRAPSEPLFPSPRGDVFAFASLVFLALVLVYCGFRAALISLSHDEALTYIIQRTNSFLGILTYVHPIMANNHFLNTYLVKVFTSLFGSSELVNRMPALMGFLLYGAGVWGIGRVLLRGFRFLWMTVLLSMHPFLIDFFTCNRGYGLGVGLLTLALYFLMRRLRDAGGPVYSKDSLWVASLSALAVFAQLTYVPVYGALLCILVFLEAVFVFSGGQAVSLGAKIGVLFKRLAATIGPGVVFLLVVVARPALDILGDSEIHDLPNSGFWQRTVTSLVEVTAYGRAAFPQAALLAVVKAVVVVVALVCALLALRRLRKQPLTLAESFLLCLGGVFFLYAGVLAALHALTGAAYPVDRWALFYFPLFFLILVFLLEEAGRSSKAFLRGAAAFLFYGFTGLLCLHFFSCANLAYFYDWKYDADTKKALEIIQQMEANSALEPKSVTLKNSWLFRPAIHYYVVTRRLWWLDRDPDRIKRDGQADYYFLPEEDAAVLEREPFEVIRKFKVSGAVLARPRNRRVRPAAGGQAPFGADLSYDAYQNKMTDDFLKTTGINDGAAAFVGRAHYFEAQEKWEAAVGDYNRALRARPSDQEAYVALLGRAEAYARTDQLEKALADLTRAIRLLPDVGAGYWLRSGVFEKMGDAARAAEDRQKAYALGVRPRPAEPGMSLSGPANDGKIEQTEKAAD